MNLPSTAKSHFLEALRHLSMDEILPTHVRCQQQILHLGHLSYALADFSRVVVVSIGKAAASMWDALLPILAPSLQRSQSIEAIVVGTARPLNGEVQFFQGSHPFPNRVSVDAADAVLELLSSCDDRCLVLFLVSGGASAMVEKSLDPNATVEDLAGFYRALVQSGLPIAKMNALRKHFSRVKGGRMAVAAQHSTQCTVLISDAPENMLHIVGSGPSLPDPSTAEQCRRILSESGIALRFSPAVRAFFADLRLPETPKASHPAFDRSAWLSLLSSNDLCRFAGESAARLGFHVVIDNSCDEWDYRKAAAYLLQRLRGLRRDHARVCLLSAGEISVELPSRHGTGGRNQQFVLECARLLAEMGLNATVLSGGSDGIDGNSPAAGAVCDRTTVARAAGKGFDVAQGLDQFDSFTIFNALDDAILTGPTGNNVRDLRILLSPD